MASLLDDASTDPEAALRQWLRKKQAPPRLGEYIMGSGRAGWKFLLPIRKDAKVLDLGCGWGALAHSMGQSCGCVVAMDSTLERMQFLCIRAAQEEGNRIHFVCAGDQKYLPFDDQTFDLVILNGVLEWVPCDRKGNPEIVQLEFLREVKRVLRDSGVLYLAIENRYSWKTWSRQPDGHTGLRFVPWMPRRLADLYSRLKGCGPYRNYLYGKRQYERLLKEAGFEKTEFYVPLPGYHHPSAMVPAQDKSRIVRSFARARSGITKPLRQCARAFLSSRFPACYGIIAGGRAPESSFVDRLHQHLNSQMPERFPGGAKVVLYRIQNEMGMVTVVMKDPGGNRAGFVLKFPLHERSEKELQRESQCFADTDAQTHELSCLRKLLPNLLTEGTFEQQYYAAFTVLPGVTAEHLPGGLRKTRRALVEAAAFAVRLHRCTERLETDWTKGLETLIGENVRQVTSLAASQEHEEAVARLGGTLTASLSKEEPRLVLGHRDFKLANCLFNPSSCSLTGVLDWGAGLEKELPLYDLSFLAADYLVGLNRKSFGEVLGNWMQLSDEDSWAREWIAGYAAELRIPFNDERWRTLAAYQWLRRMAPLASGHESRRFDYRYVDAMFDVLTESRFGAIFAEHLL